VRLRAALWWASLAFGVAGACLWVRLYAEIPFLAGAFCVAVAGALAGWGSSMSGTAEASASRWRLGGVAVACIACLPFISAELRIAAGVVAIGAAIAMLRAKGARRIGGGIAASGLLSLLLVGATGLFVRFAASAHEAAPLRILETWMAKLLGMGTATVGREIILPAGSRFVPAVPSWDQFGLLYGVLIVVSVVGFAALTQGSRGLARVAVRSIALTIAYLGARHFVLLLVALEMARPSVFWVPSVVLPTLVPLFLLLVRVAGVRAEWNATPLLQGGDLSPRRAAVATTAVVVGTLLVSLAFLLAPAGARSDGRVLFDEAHGEWESTSRAMDTEWYGLASTYNYDSLYRWLDDYYEVGRVTGRIDCADLQRGDTLILKTPSIPYTPNEVDAITAHVRRGGGLLVIGDHTNVFGTTSVLNPVLAPFGLRLGYDATYRLRDGGFTVYESRGTADPILQHIAQFDFLTSCSLYGGAFTLPVIYDARILANVADYSTPNFFPESRVALTSTFGAFLQAGAVEAGRGRVVAFTDSTCFSNFSLHMDGYTGFLLGTIEYLRRENPLPGWRPMATALGGIAAAGGLAIWAASRRRSAVIVGLVSVLVGCGAAAGVTAALHRAAYPVPSPRKDVPYVYFDLSESRARIEAQPSVTGPLSSRAAFNTFFTWTQRAGLVPTLVKGEARALAEGRPYVILNPTGPPGSSRERLVDYVRNKGGSLVLMGDPVRDEEALEGYCALFGLTLVPNQSQSLILSTGEVSSSKISPAQTVYTSVARIGAGRVVVVSDSVAFSDLSLGGGFTVPSTVQRRLYDLEFWLFGTLLASERRD